jgi:hypothetical protein
LNPLGDERPHFDAGRTGNLETRIMNTRRNMAALLLTSALAVALSMVGGAQFASAAGPPTRIFNDNSAMCLQPSPNNINIGVQLVQWPCNSSLEQSWLAIPLSGTNRYQFQNQATRGCMDAHGPNANGTPVDTWPCSNISNQVWTASRPLPSGFPTTLTSAVGGKCLDVTQGSHDQGALIQIFTCNGTPAQGFGNS